VVLVHIWYVVSYRPDTRATGDNLPHSLRQPVSAALLPSQYTPYCPERLSSPATYGTRALSSWKFALPRSMLIETICCRLCLECAALAIVFAPSPLKRGWKKSTTEESAVLYTYVAIYADCSVDVFAEFRRRLTNFSRTIMSAIFLNCIGYCKSLIPAQRMRAEAMVIVWRLRGNIDCSQNCCT